jgi:uncharacterized membrane protein
MYPRAPGETMSDYTIPFLHPLVVHVPIALLPAAALALVGWLVRDRIQWLVVAAWLHAAGLAGAVAALLSGEDLEHEMEGDPMVELFGHTHEEAGQRTVWAAGLLLVLILVSVAWHRRAVRRPGVPAPWRLLVALVGLLVAGLALWTGHVGGTMVWGVPR